MSEGGFPSQQLAGRQELLGHAISCWATQVLLQMRCKKGLSPLGGGDGRLGEAGRGTEEGGGAGGAEGGPAPSFLAGGPTAASYARCISESERFTNLCGLPCPDLTGACIAYLMSTTVHTTACKYCPCHMQGTQSRAVSAGQRSSCGAISAPLVAGKADPWLHLLPLVAQMRWLPRLHRHPAPSISRHLHCKIGTVRSWACCKQKGWLPCQECCNWSMQSS